jgi:hypothetical protein
MKRKKLKGFPCRCGHPKARHIIAPVYLGGDSWCMPRNYLECDCSNYVPDNLKFLESRYNESTKKRGKK